MTGTYPHTECVEIAGYGEVSSFRKVLRDLWLSFTRYGASIPYHIAMDPSRGVMLALEMNGKPLSQKHGAPVRVITPGIAGARSVKWLDTITIQPKESTNYYQRHDYKILPSDVDSAEKAEQWWDKVPALEDMPINSVIAVPASDSTVRTEADEHYGMSLHGARCIS
jgi:sulfite oxidase